MMPVVITMTSAASTPASPSNWLDLAISTTRISDPGCSAAARLDPYWAAIWNPGATARWLSRSSAKRRADMGVGELPKALADRSEKLAIRDLFDKRFRADRLSALAAIGMWRTITNEQLACLVGRPSLASRRSVDGDVLWASGLVERGRLQTDMRQAQPVTLYRPDRAGNFAELERRLGLSDWSGVTAGVPWKWGSQFDRHNVLATELALRAAEYTDIACVLGESVAGLDRIATSLGIRSSRRTSRAADALFIREDGMLIAVEMTATVTSNLKQKIDNWNRLLAADQAKRLVVVFVECAHPDSPSASNKVYSQLRKLIATCAHASTSAACADLPERMLVARWIDWFPTHGYATRDFLALQAHRPTGTPGDRWERLSMFDPFAFPFNSLDDEYEDAILAQYRSFFGVPHWMQPTSPDFSGVVHAIAESNASTATAANGQTASRRTIAAAASLTRTTAKPAAVRPQRPPLPAAPSPSSVKPVAAPRTSNA